MRGGVGRRKNKLDGARRWGWGAVLLHGEPSHLSWKETAMKIDLNQELEHRASGITGWGRRNIRRVQAHWKGGRHSTGLMTSTPTVCV